MTDRNGEQDLTPEQKELLEKMRERHRKALEDMEKNPPGRLHDPGKWDPMPGHDPEKSQLDPVELIVPRCDPGRLKGALLGLAVGDALGTTLEFRHDVNPPRFPELATGPHRDITGGGPFGLVPGQVTDDTQMACCLFASLMARRDVDVVDIAARYAAWTRHAFDMGGQTRAALDGVQREGDPRQAGRRVWEERGRQAAGNGSLMRTAPIGALFAASADLRRRASFEDSAITHFDPRCQLACAALNAAISRAVARQPATPGDLVAAARAELDAGAGALAEAHADLARLVAEGRDALARDLDAAERDDPELYGPELHLHRQEGFVRVAFRLAFWELCHASGFAAALIDVANRGGDADTNAAIAGALLGALYSVDAIPRAWQDAVLDALQDGRDSHLSGELHPRVFVAGLDRLYGAAGPTRG